MSKTIFLPDGQNYARCAHYPKKLDPAFLDYIGEDVGVKVTIVNLTMQLQVDGTFRKVGMCPDCGQVYATEEIFNGGALNEYLHRTKQE